MSTKKDEKHVIWSNIDLDLEDWREDLLEWYDYGEELDEDDLYTLMYRDNHENLYAERDNLNIRVNNPILVIGDLGLWNGRFSGYKEIRSCNIQDCLYDEDADYIEWYVDGLGDLRAIAIHHDGTNYYLYRVWKDGTTEIQRENLMDKIYHGKATRSDITRLTKRLGDEIANVYGWNIPKMKKGA